VESDAGGKNLKGDLLSNAEASGHPLPSLVLGLGEPSPSECFDREKTDRQ